MNRAYFTLSTVRNRALAIRAIEKAPEGWTVEMREPKRTDPQNRALWSLLGQVAKARPFHNGVKMDAELWKATFMDALGAEVTFLPKLDGFGMFAAGHRSSKLGKREFADLIELILAWCAGEGIEIRHFDEAAEPATERETA